MYINRDFELHKLIFWGRGICNKTHICTTTQINTLEYILHQPGSMSTTRNPYPVEHASDLALGNSARSGGFIWCLPGIPSTCGGTGSTCMYCSNAVKLTKRVLWIIQICIISKYFERDQCVDRSPVEVALPQTQTRLFYVHAGNPVPY